MKTASNSVGRIDSAFDWGRENLQFLFMRLQGLQSKEADLEKLLVELDEYQHIYETLTDKSFRNASIFEVGYGARPLRLIGLTSMGLNARGIDLDAPMLRGSTRDLLRILRTNGWKRFLKSAIRSKVFDAHERRALDRVLHRRGARLQLLEDRFLVGDVAKANLPASSVDLFYSEDVFEHIPREELDGICNNMARALKHGGVALIAPSVFTGIGGGHLVEWYPNTLNEDRERRSDAWEHLRLRRYRADCYLNEVRLNEYHEIFSRHFHVERVDNLDAGRGKRFLTPQIRKELAQYTEEELLGDKWRFVLRKKSMVTT